MGYQLKIETGLRSIKSLRACFIFWRCSVGTKGYNMPEKYFIGAFNHNFTFKFLYYAKVISIEVENQVINASLRQGKIIIMGSYEVVICYQKEEGGEDGNHYYKKAFKEFGVVISPPGNMPDYQLQTLIDNIKLETSLGINFLTPVSCIKAFLERLKLLSVTLEVAVTGKLEGEEAFIDDPDELFKESPVQEQNNTHEAAKDFTPSTKVRNNTNYQLYYDLLMKQIELDNSRKSKQFKQP